MAHIARFVEMVIFSINKTASQPVQEVPTLIVFLECVWTVLKDVLIALAIHSVFHVSRAIISIAHLASAFLVIQFA
jgi:hypothetical protein